MASADKKASLSAHLEKTKKSLSEVLAGSVPEKHKLEKESYITFLKKEIMLSERTLANVKG